MTKPTSDDSTSSSESECVGWILDVKRSNEVKVVAQFCHEKGGEAPKFIDLTGDENGRYVI